MELYQKDNHCKYEITHKETDQATRAILESILAEEYRITGVTSAAQVEEAEVNSNNFRIRTSKGDYLLRRTARDTKPILTKAYNILTHCRERGVPTPEIIPNQGHEPITERDSLYTLFNFIPGNHCSGSLEETIELGRGMALLHNALETYPREVPATPPPSMRLDTPYSAMGFTILQGIAEARDDSVLPLLKAEMDYLTRKADKVKAAIESAKVRKGTIHSDVHLYNTLFLENNLAAILDFDGCFHSELVRDIGFTLHRVARQHAANYNTHKPIENARTTRDAFLRGYESISPLTLEERRTLHLFAQDEGLHRTWYTLSKHLVDCEHGWTHAIPKHILAIKESELLKTA